MRSELQVDLLRQCIVEADAAGHPTRQAVWEQAARMYLERTDMPVSVSRTRTEGLRTGISTPLGRRGGPQPGSGRARRAVRDVRRLKGAVPRRYWHLVERVSQGSRAAADKLKCLECMDWRPGEVRRCSCEDCPLWNFRPYRQDFVKLTSTP